MRHRFDHRKLGRKKPHRKAMLANMVTSLFDKERIQTTDEKAKEARREAEKLITRAKKGHAAHKQHETLKEAGNEAESKNFQAVALAHWREAGRVVRSHSVLRKLFEEIAPQYMERPGGYTRIVKLGSRRLGDNARTVLLELVGTKVTSAPLVRKSKKKGEKEEATGDEKAKGKKGGREKKEGRVEDRKEGRGRIRSAGHKQEGRQKRPDA
jgi:large subunit ribosomal protein L17